MGNQKVRKTPEYAETRAEAKIYCVRLLPRASFGVRGRGVAVGFGIISLVWYWYISGERWGFWKMGNPKV